MTERKRIGKMEDEFMYIDLGGVGYLIWTVILLIELLAVLLRYDWNKRKEG